MTDEESGGYGYVLTPFAKKLERENNSLRSQLQAAEAREAVLRVALAELVTLISDDNYLPIDSFSLQPAQKVLSQTSPRAEALLQIVEISRRIDLSDSEERQAQTVDDLSHALLDYDQAKEKP